MNIIYFEDRIGRYLLEFDMKKFLQKMTLLEFLQNISTFKGVIFK